MAANPTDTPRHFYTLDEYFALEHASDARYEYWDGDVICMSGGSLAHGIIAGNVFRAISSRLAGGPCRAFTADTAVRTPTLPPYRYPDASVVCGEPRVENIRGVDALLNPVLIVEILSPSTEVRDRGDKLTAYKAIATFQEYLLVDQKRPWASAYLRQLDGTWATKDVTDLSAAIDMRSINVDISLTDVYDGVTFPAVG